MEILEIIDRIDAVFISPKATVTQLKHEEDDEPYHVWRIDSDNTRYILKEVKEGEYLGRDSRNGKPKFKFIEDEDEADEEENDADDSEANG